MAEEAGEGTVTEQTSEFGEYHFDNGIIIYMPRPGTDIADVCKDAWHVAIQASKPVTFIVNDVLISMALLIEKAQ